MQHYFPGPGDAWERVEPAAAGLSADALADACAYATAHESPWPTSMYLDDGRYIGTAYLNEPPPYNQPLGPVRPRSPTNGVVIRHGRIVTSWGDLAPADMTFSVAKSYLSVVTGLAVADGAIPSIDSRIGELVRDGGFDPPHNDAITWRHLLTQTSEWQGTLWDRPDSVDHNRGAGGTEGAAQKGALRALQHPGTHWEYNDVRVNRLALAVLRVLRRPLPEILRERIMAPIGASDRWEWHGYRNSSVDIDGRMIESVSGGGHWGGGLCIPTLDHARLGLLIHRGGIWNERRLLPAQWIAASREPCPLNPSYGLMWWLNTGRKRFPSAPESSVFALGAGSHMIWLDDVHDIVVVARWIESAHFDGIIERVLASVH